MSDWIGSTQSKMYTIFIAAFLHISFCTADSNILDCAVVCLPGDMQCGFDIKSVSYKMFSSRCAMAAYSSCHSIEYVQTPLKYCIKSTQSALQGRRYEESCPVFCPSHYRPVCGASRFRSYVYRAFTNGCYLDMVNCRGDDDFYAYAEVPLHFCQRHLMKNIYREQVVVSGMHDYVDYDGEDA